MNRSRRYLIAAAVIIVPLLLYGSAVAISGLYASTQTIDLPVMPTFAYSTVTFPTPIVFGSPFPTIPTVPTVTTSSAITPTVTITNTPLPTWTPTTYIVSYGTPITPFYYYYPVYPTPYRTPTLSPPSTTTLPPPPASALSDVAGCYNILYPVKPAQHWGYYVTAGSRSGNMGMTVVSVQGGFGNVNIVNQSRGTNSSVQVVCDRDIILNFPFLNAETLLGDALNGTVNVAYSGGVLAPNEAAFNASNWALSWTSQYIINGSGSIVYNGNTFNITIAPSNVTMNCQTLASGDAAFENITVAAGAYRALKVICTVQGQVTGTANGSAVSGVVRAQSTQWFAPYIGPVKIRAEYANLEVFGITIPLNSGAAGTIELTNFSPGP
ncbi:MAG: hypothetical protein MUO77_17915 [Anaerolineales bacterium]|nr:hypothetical protein [Anaerolineales bacterium]